MTSIYSIRILSCLLLTLLVGLPSAPAAAQVSLCNGIWVNRACEGRSVQRALPKEQATPNPEKLARSQKLSLVHEVTMKSIRAREDFSVSMNSTELARYCENASTTLDACKRRIEEFEEDLDREIAGKSKTTREKRKQALDEKKEHASERIVGRTSIRILRNSYGRHSSGGFPGKELFHANHLGPHPYAVHPVPHHPASQGIGHTDPRGHSLPNPNARSPITTKFRGPH